MSDGSPRWPHHQYTERHQLGLPSGDFWTRLAELSDRAERLQGIVEVLLQEPELPTILVVEDDPAARKALERILTLQGWAVASVATVADGLAALEPPPTCVILDLMLPDGDGSTILQAARASGLATRFVVTTGVADLDHLETLASLGPDAVLQKPVTLEELCQACLG